TAQLLIDDRSARYPLQLDAALAPAGAGAGATAIDQGGTSPASASEPFSDPPRAVMAWGLNGSGQLGDGGTEASQVPVPVSGLSGVRAVSAGSDHSLALLSDGTLMAWGDNGKGQLGNGGTEASQVPVPVSGLSGVSAVSAGNGDSLALLSDGTVVAWGANFDGQLGNGGTEASAVPVPVSGLSGVSSVSAGGWHGLASGSPPPALISVSPNSGGEACGTSVTISGTDLMGATAVKFGSADASSFTVSSATSIVAVSPPGTGAVDVTVTTPGGTAPAG